MNIISLCCPDSQTTQPFREGKFAAMAARKRNLEGHTKPPEPEKSAKREKKEKEEI